MYKSHVQAGSTPELQLHPSGIIGAPIPPNTKASTSGLGLDCMLIMSKCTYKPKLEARLQTNAPIGLVLTVHLDGRQEDRNKEWSEDLNA